MRDNDVYVGAVGHAAYVAAHGPVPSGLDGEYHIAQPDAGGLRIGGDHTGTSALFLYRQNRFWALSNSFADLLDLIRQRGDSVSVVPDVMRACRHEQSMFQKTSTFQTCIAEITLVPSFADIHVSGDVLQIVPRPPEPLQDYLANLTRFRDQTFGRCNAIVAAGHDLTLDLTGGVDSRCILAAVWQGYGADQFRALNAEGRIKVRSLPELADDFVIAQSLANALGIILTTPRGMLISDQLASSALADETATQKANRQRSYRNWKRDKLGRLAIIDHFEDRVTSRYSVSGIHAGSLKSHLTYETDLYDGAAFLDDFRAGFGDDELFTRYRARVIADLEQVAKATGLNHLPFSTLRNREFAMRLHANGSLGRTRLFPLGFRSMLDAAAALPVPLTKHHKMHHDIIHAAGEVFFNHPYDSDRKAPQPGVPVDPLPPVASRPTGRVHDDPPEPVTQPAPLYDIPLLQTTFQHALRAARSPQVAALLGADYTEKAARRVRHIAKGPAGIVRAFHMARMHTLILADEVSSLARPAATPPAAPPGWLARLKNKIGK